ncbi:MAG: exo-alpha-sialidase [Pseudonocardiales bacterium]|jgi:hypothetical protein|nr:exo-alpha-sialidase [Pseudonocardiales bacterium]
MSRPLRSTAALALAVAALTACSSPDAPDPAAAGPVFEHVHGIGIDPADGALYVASHDGLFRSGPGGLVLAGAGGRDLMGFTIAGPGRLLSSGHPGPGDTLPEPIGLAESTDGGVSWTPLSLTGEVDFHALDTVGETVYGYDATNGLLRASTDSGRTWDVRATLDALDIAVDPLDGQRVLATVQGGTAVSTDGGRTFSTPTGPQLAYVSAAPNGTVYGLDLESGLHTTSDGGVTWTATGTVPGARPQAVTATADEVLAATAGGVFRSTDSGVTFSPVR